MRHARASHEVDGPRHAGDLLLEPGELAVELLHVLVHRLPVLHLLDLQGAHHVAHLVQARPHLLAAEQLARLHVGVEGAGFVTVLHRLVPARGGVRGFVVVVGLVRGARGEARGQGERPQDEVEGRRRGRGAASVVVDQEHVLVLPLDERALHHRLVGVCHHGNQQVEQQHLRCHHGEDQGQRRQHGARLAQRADVKVSEEAPDGDEARPRPVSLLAGGRQLAQVDSAHLALEGKVDVREDAVQARPRHAAPRQRVLGHECLEGESKAEEHEHHERQPLQQVLGEHVARADGQLAQALEDEQGLREEAAEARERAARDEHGEEPDAHPVRRRRRHPGRPREQAEEEGPEEDHR
mmetsp:Transcript_26586/g.78226  ORF Transcript_26586/g.78226 Transcript_26586/m.78226 type:complete len:353 (+) Transcript_26586:1091-2149(+)